MDIPIKDLDKWVREHPMILSNVMRAQVFASHLLILEELRAMQDKTFDHNEEVGKINDLQKILSAVFDMEYEKELFSQLLQKREELHREADGHKD